MPERLLLLTGAAIFAILGGLHWLQVSCTPPHQGDPWFRIPLVGLVIASTCFLLAALRLS